MNRQELRNLVLGVVAIAVLLLALELVGRVVADAWSRGDLYPDHHHPSTYVISGIVTDGASQALPGVSIYDGKGHSVTSDDKGNYVFNGLLAGSYNVWAYKNGYVFLPQTRAITLPPSAARQDFVGTFKWKIFLPVLHRSS